MAYNNKGFSSIEDPEGQAPPSYDEVYTSQQPGPYPLPPPADQYPQQAGYYPQETGQYLMQAGPYPSQAGPYPPQADLYPPQAGPYPPQPGQYPPHPQTAAPYTITDTTNSTTNSNSARELQKKNHLPIILALCVLGVGFLLFIIGFSTIYWAYDCDDCCLKTGLWKQCKEWPWGYQKCTTLVGNGIPAAWQIAQTCECFGMIGYIAAGVVTLLLLFVDDKMFHQIKIAPTICSWGAAGFIGLAVFIWGMNNFASAHVFHYSFVLSVISMVPAIIHGFMLVIMIKK